MNKCLAIYNTVRNDFVYTQLQVRYIRYNYTEIYVDSKCIFLTYDTIFMCHRKPLSVKFSMKMFV